MCSVPLRVFYDPETAPRQDPDRRVAHCVIQDFPICDSTRLPASPQGRFRLGRGDGGPVSGVVLSSVGVWEDLVVGEKGEREGGLTLGSRR